MQLYSDTGNHYVFVAGMTPIPPPFCTLAPECPYGPHVILPCCGSGSRSVGAMVWRKLKQDMGKYMDIALFEPDIAHNTGAILRLGACFGVAVHIIEPAGFDASNRALKRAALDYLDRVKIHRHVSFDAFEAWRSETARRLVLLTTKSDLPYTQFKFLPDDLLLLGRESAGVPEDVHAKADASVIVPLAGGMRSLNVATTAAMVLGEALRQTDGFAPL